MKLVIFAGGYGTRLGKRTVDIPKPMVKIGDHPIIWHIMKYYSTFGIKDFIICLGYKGDVIKNYFKNYKTINNDFTINLNDGSLQYHTNKNEDWNITLIDTGQKALKGSRLFKIKEYLDDEVNLLTYGDGLSNIDISILIKEHTKSSNIVTISGVHPPARFGELIVTDGSLKSFQEKAQTSQGLINGGFMVFDKSLFNYLSVDDNCDLEIGAFDKLVMENKIGVFRHNGSWACMDNERDLKYLENLWNTKKAFWKVW